MIKAILWDFGGVITTSPFEAFNRYEKENGIPVDFIRKVNSTNPLDNAWAKFESSRISIDQFDREFETESKAAGFAIPGRHILSLLVGDIRPKMVSALKSCKEHFTVGCLTNNMKFGKNSNFPAENSLAKDYQKVMNLFDHVIESSVEGVRKPDPEIYRIALDRLQVKPDECIFLDDLGINLKPAKAMGMKTIKVVDPDEALKELEVFTGVSFA